MLTRFPVGAIISYMKRRTFVKMAAMGTALAWSGISLARPRPATDWLEGIHLARWKILEVGEIQRGVLPVAMQAHDGSRFIVEIAARSASGPRAVAETSRYALYLANGGDGNTSTVEEHGLGAMALAAALRSRDAAGPKLRPLFG
jgi:hypothetical protein